MSNARIDEIARILATPMPRRDAVRSIAATLAAGLWQALSPARAFASTGRTSLQGGTQRCFVAIKFGTHEGGQYYPAYSKCCTGPNLDRERPNLMSWVCPKDWGCGTAGACTPVCSAPKFACGRGCCEAPSLCYDGRCRAACPPTTVKCGNDCCMANQACIGGKCCEVCGGNRVCCDPATTYCCREMGQPNSQGRCCKKDLESCCGVGPDGAQSRMCCAKPNRCVKELPTGIGGLTSSSPWVCCPPERQVPVDETKPDRVIACCAPGQVTLGGKLVVGIGIQGMCCNASQICGSGAGLTCCQTGQSCINGKCA